MKKQVFWMYWSGGQWWRSTWLLSEDDVQGWLLDATRGMRFCLLYGDPSRPSEAKVLAEVVR